MVTCLGVGVVQPVMPGCCPVCLLIGSWYGKIRAEYTKISSFKVMPCFAVFYAKPPISDGHGLESGPIQGLVLCQISDRPVEEDQMVGTRLRRSGIELLVETESCALGPPVEADHRLILFKICLDASRAPSGQGGLDFSHLLAATELSCRDIAHSTVIMSYNMLCRMSYNMFYLCKHSYKQNLPKS